MSKADILRIPDYLGHIIEAIVGLRCANPTYAYCARMLGYAMKPLTQPTKTDFARDGAMSIVGRVSVA